MNRHLDWCHLVRQPIIRENGKFLEVVRAGISAGVNLLAVAQCNHQQGRGVKQGQDLPLLSTGGHNPPAASVRRAYGASWGDW